MLGHHKEALSASGSLVKHVASHEPWVNDSPRMMAATLGANAAMQLGLSENALSFYQLVLKFDPEQPRARMQYRGLKKVVKLMNKAEEQVSSKTGGARVRATPTNPTHTVYHRYKRATTRWPPGSSTTVSWRCADWTWTLRYSAAKSS